MTNDSGELVQLVTRVPRDLKRRLKVHCFLQDVTMMNFVIDTISEELSTTGDKTSARRKSRRTSK
jgi:hypothetical protein